MASKGEGKGAPPPPPRKSAAEMAAAKEEKQKKFQAEREERQALRKSQNHEASKLRESQVARAKERLAKTKIPTTDAELNPELVLSKEPTVQTPPEILKSFESGVNSRPDLQGKFGDCIAMHGTNLAAVIQALRGANGQLVPMARCQELNISPVTGESMNDPSKSHKFVCGANLLGKGEWGPNSTLAEGYALKEAGRIDHWWGPADICETSIAARIPVLVVGDIVDPSGAGAKYAESQITDAALAEAVERSQGLETTESVRDMAKACIWGERLNIRMIFVWDPENQENDPRLRSLVDGLIKKIDAEVEAQKGDAGGGSSNASTAASPTSPKPDPAASRPSLMQALFGQMCCAAGRGKPVGFGDIPPPASSGGYYGDIHVGLFRHHVRVFNEAMLGRKEAIVHHCIQRHLYEQQMEKQYPAELA